MIFLAEARISLTRMRWRAFEPAIKRSLGQNNRSKSTNQLSSTHNPSEFESKWYAKWQGIIEANNKNPDKPLFSMILPPPNITGHLHLGHAITATIQDVIVRWKIMNGFRTRWIPGYDHAGIATQVVVEKKLFNEQKKTRHALGKHDFLNEIHKWKESKMMIIKDQVIKLNSLVNWDYEYFTMDQKIQNSVTEAFIHLHERNLIFRAVRPINWCCTLKSAISDIEIENKIVETPSSIKVPGCKKPVELGYLYSYAYPIYDANGRRDNGERIVVATTRPETMFGDIAIAVNPSDTRYSHLNGQLARNPLNDDLIPIIFDDHVDPAFGTGAVKVTASHDFADYEIAHRHGLTNFKSILNDDGNLINVPSEYLGLNRFEARRVVIEKLKALGLYESTKPHQMTVPICSRTGDLIEPMLKEQWFVKTEEMFKASENAVKTGALRLIPSNRKNLWNQYTSKFIKDWCVSRQLWWGQRIPAYKCRAASTNDGHRWFAARDMQEARKKAVDYFQTDSIEVEQDPDVFDTWFTSTLLPLAIFGWPNHLGEYRCDFQETYPTNLLETGHDIMFFWVLRMVAMCHALTGQVPFRDVLFHGLVLDGQGRKMSKSIGNVIDPIDLIDGISLVSLKTRIENSNLDEKERKVSLKAQETLYPNGIKAIGSDALRLGLLVQEFKDDTMSIDINTFATSKTYCNKIWQANRFVNMFIGNNQKNSELDEIISNENCGLIDKWLIHRLIKITKTVENNFNNEYNLHGSIISLRKFFLNDFCDFYIEYAKFYQKNFNNDNGKTDKQKLIGDLLKVTMNSILLMYHPFVPCLTEELYKENDQMKFESILNLPYPNFDKYSKLQDYDTSSIDKTVNIIQKIVNSVLNVRQTLQMNENPIVYVEFVHGDNIELGGIKANLIGLKNELTHLSKALNYEFNDDFKSRRNQNSIKIMLTDYLVLYLEFKKEINFKLQIERLASQLEKKQNKLKKLTEKISHQNYLKKMAINEQNNDQKLIQEYKHAISQINENIEMIKSHRLNGENNVDKTDSSQ